MDATNVMMVEMKPSAWRRTEPQSFLLNLSYLLFFPRHFPFPHGDVDLWVLVPTRLLGLVTHYLIPFLSTWHKCLGQLYVLEGDHSYENHVQMRGGKTSFTYVSSPWVGCIFI